MLNTTSVTGLAGDKSDQLKAAGYNVDPAASLSPTRQNSVVEYQDGHEADAAAVAKELNLSASAIAPMEQEVASAGSSGADVIVVIARISRAADPPATPPPAPRGRPHGRSRPGAASPTGGREPVSEPRELASLPGRRVAAASLILALVLTAIAFAAAQRLKRGNPARLWHAGDRALLTDARARAEIGPFLFRLHRSDDITITIVTPQGDPVRTLDRDLAVTAGREIRRDWDGAADSGRLAPDGAYRVQLTLRRAGRAVVLPDVLLTKDTTPPNPKCARSARSATLAPRALSCCRAPMASRSARATA